MFELPEAKRICRNEILSPSSSTRSSPEIAPADDEEAHARLGRLLAFDTFTPDTNQDIKNAGNTDIAHNQQDGGQANDDDTGEQEFEFRLFSAPSKKATDSTTLDATSKGEKHKPNNEAIPGDGEGEGIKTQKLKIRLRSPTPVDTPPGEGRFVVPFRGWEYYFTKPELMHISARDPARLEAEEANRRSQFEDIAVTGADVLQWAQTTKTPGCHLPWRVMHLNPKAHRVPKSLLRQTAGTEKTQMVPATSFTAAAETKKNSTPGKKRRIILRTRAAKVAAAATAAAANANMTEAEKRNKKNREKKIRKRQREREKKAALAASTGDAAVVSDAEAADSSD